VAEAGRDFERETFALASLANAVTAARFRAVAVAARHPLEMPDSFRLIDDATGTIVLTVNMYDRRSGEVFPRQDGRDQREASTLGLHPIFSLLL
jgi:hypothetical protein